MHLHDTQKLQEHSVQISTVMYQKIQHSEKQD